jgi:threonine dehydratase
MTLESVMEAHRRIKSHLHQTPILSSLLLDAHTTGAQLFFKAENLQKVGAFKARGALNAVLLMDSPTLARGLATHSSGNHGAALAYAGRIVGALVHVVMPEDSLPNKIDAVRGYGAKLTLCAPTLEARDAACERIVRETGATLVHPYDDDRIIAGQGTAALEFLDQTPELDILMTPIGGGGLISGSAIVAKGLRKDLHVIGAEPAHADDAFRSWKAGELLSPNSMNTIADGLRAGIGVRNFRYLNELVDDVLLVSEEAIVRTTNLLMHYLKTVVEPSAAVPMAAVLEHPEKFAGKRVGIILSGGNLDLDAPPWL